MQLSRYRYLRRVLPMFMAIALLVGSFTTVFAQATPTASDGTGPALGDTVVLFDNQSDETVHIAVASLVDPDESVTRTDRGFHWIGIELVVENVSDSPFAFNSFGPAIVDAEGFVTDPSFVSRPDDDEEARPEFETGDIEPGATVSGWMFFQVINGSTPALVTYSDVTDQFTILANLGGTSLDPTGPVPIYDASATEVGSVTVDEIITGFEAVDSSVVPPRGMTSVAASITIENSSSREMESDSYSVSLVDDLGFRYRPMYLNRPDANEGDYPNFPNDPIAAGDSASGVVLFEIPAAATVNYLLYQPDRSQLYVIAQPGEGSITTGTTIEPAATATAVAPSADCDGIDAWVESSRDNINAINEISFINENSIASVEPDVLREGATVLRDAAAAQEALDVPVAAEALNEAILSFLNTYADGFEEAADRVEAGEDPVDVDADLDERADFGDVLNELFEASTALETACPDADLDSLFG